MLTKGLTLKTEPTAARLRELLSYDPADGTFTRKTASGTAQAGAVAGWICSNSGYRIITIDGRKCRAHRLAVLYMHGKLPTKEVDHRNGIRADNRWDNLREASRQENCQNRSASKKNTSGFPGVTWDASRRKWVAQVKAERRNHYLGRFDCPAKAHAAYLAAKSRLHPFNPGVRQP